MILNGKRGVTDILVFTELPTRVRIPYKRFNLMYANSMLIHRDSNTTFEFKFTTNVLVKKKP
jgi:hypothetical protein